MSSKEFTDKTETYRLEICGGIAAGKTTLAQLLKHQGFPVEYERYWDNPFLNSFYSNEHCCFETEIVFTLIHYHGLLKNKGGCSDYSLIQDLAYADVNLYGTEYIIYENLYQYLISQIGLPSHLIYVKCSVPEAYQRLQSRNRQEEINITKTYMGSIVSALEKRIFNHPNLLVLDSEQYNFLTQEEEIFHIVYNYFIKNKIRER